MNREQDHIANGVQQTPFERVPDTYRGWTIEQNWLDEYEGTGPGFDADWNDEDGRFVGNGEMCTAKTWEGLREEIDAYIEEHPSAASSAPAQAPHAAAHDASGGRGGVA